MQSLKASNEPVFLGIEAGATRTVSLLADAGNQLVQRHESGAANVRLMSDVELFRHFQEIARAFPRPAALGIGMAGARTESDRERIREAIGKLWPQIQTRVSNDLETALLAGGEDKKIKAATRVLILSGTGSCCYGQDSAGKTVRVGGWGHLIGDKGSGYEIGLRSLKAVVFHYDRKGIWPDLGVRLLHALQLNEPNDLIGWVQSASKTSIAGLAIEVFRAWEKGDAIAKDILAGAASSLSRDAVDCARRLARKGEAVQFVLAGSVLVKQPRFVRQIARLIRRDWKQATIAPLRRESAWGAVQMARQAWSVSLETSAQSKFDKVSQSISSDTSPLPVNATPPLSPTEQRNPKSMNLDRLTIAQAVRLMLDEDSDLPSSILAEAAGIEKTVEMITRAFKQGGRLLYVGAGTSGRLGVLDASECPPTFRSAPEMVQGIIAGGQGALWRSVEGAEDDPAAGARAIEFRKVTRKDVVVGIAASGRTPYVWGALAEAKRRRARTVMLAFNPCLTIPASTKPDVVIAPNLGPEILTGSTRLKSGTATKLILNIFTTLAMVRIGKVVSNLMVDLNPSNVKLRERAVRILMELKGVDARSAQQALEASGWVIKKASTWLDRMQA